MIPVMRRENVQCLSVFSNDLCSQAVHGRAQLLRWSNQDLAGGQGFNNDPIARRVAELLELSRNHNDIAVAEAADLHDLHGINDIYRYPHGQGTPGSHGSALSTRVGAPPSFDGPGVSKCKL